jgi:hypothetical protein
MEYDEYIGKKSKELIGMDPDYYLNKLKFEGEEQRRRRMIKYGEGAEEDETEEEDE